MKSNYGFTLFENPQEFKAWLNKQTIKRKITRIQEHHTATRISIADKYDNLTLQNNMKTFHVKSRGFADIAQHFTIFPDGTIVTGRSLESAPAGIKGANSGAICIENYGWFDKGYDKMPQVMADAIVAYTKILLDKFHLVPSASSITYHAWWTASGSYLGDYIAGKSCKTCPGNQFFGGNTAKAFTTNFLPKVKAYKFKRKKTTETKKNTTTKTKKAYGGRYPSGTIKNGSSGDKVKKLQKYLNWYGNYGLTVDGKCGTKTVNAIKDFQKKEKLTVDGIWGSKSLAAAKKVKK